MTQGIAKYIHRRPMLISVFLLSLLGAGYAGWHRFSSSEDGKSGFRIAADHATDDKDFIERLGAAWRAGLKMVKDFHPRP